MTTQNNAPSGQESSQFTLGDSPDRRESTAASGVLPTTSSSSPGGVTYRPVKRSPRVCPSCGGKKAAHAVSCRACRTEQERDGHQCVMMGKTRMLEAHHIDHDPTNNVLTNLISLSRPAHEFYHSLRAGPQAALRSWFEEKVK